MANGRRNRGHGKRGRGHGAVSATKVRKIVKEMNEKAREKKHLNITQSDYALTTTGTNFTIDPSPIAQGITNSSRIGNDVNWTSWFMKMVISTGYNTAYPHMVRMIWYTPRIETDVIPTSTGVMTFLDSDKYIIHSDRIVKVGTGIERGSSTDAPSGVDSFKVLHFGKRFKKAVRCVYDSPSAHSLLTPTRKLYMVSTNSSGAATYSTLVNLSATIYFTDP